VLSGTVRKRVSRNNVIRKRAVNSGRPPSSTGRHRKGKTLTSPVYIGVRNLRFIDQSHRPYLLTGDLPSTLYTAAISLNW
jgi:hypothetical protein